MPAIRCISHTDGACLLWRSICVEAKKKGADDILFVASSLILASKMPKVNRRATDGNKENQTRQLEASDFSNGCAALNQQTTTTHDFLELFGVVSSGNSKTNTLLRDGFNTKGQRELLKQCIRESTAKLGKFFEGLRKLVVETVESQSFIPESAFEEEDDAYFTDEAIHLDAKSVRGLQLLAWAAICVKESFTTSKKKLVCDKDRWKTVVYLHDALDQMDPSWGSEASSAQTAVVSLCEKVWLCDMPLRHAVIVKALPPLVEAACHQKVDLKRLYGLRSALEIIDFETEESAPFAALLLRVASSPACLKLPEGKKFLAYLFHIGLQDHIHQSIKIQIPDNKRSVLSDYGDIYFLAWKDCPDDTLRAEFETEVVQDLMYAAIHAAKSGTASALLVVLGRIHSQKNQKNVEKLLYRLYSPILWRSFAAANALVRENAVRILGDIFPLRGSEKSRHPLDKAIKALKKALQDPNPKVRATACNSVANILKVYWEVVPTEEIQSFLDRKLPLQFSHV